MGQVSRGLNMSRPDTEVWTIGRILQWTTGFFGHHQLDSPRLDAEILIAHALKCQRVELYTRHSMPLSPGDRTSIRELVRRRTRDREPVAYILGSKEFYGLSFEVGPDVLIPRPETEALIEAALTHLRAWEGEGPRVLDVGTGSGAIAVVLAHQVPGLRVVATDISEGALAVARRNAQTHEVREGIDFLHADGLSIPAELYKSEGKFQMLISNPPYISPSYEDSLAPEILRHEPRTALFAPDDGDAMLQVLIDGAPSMVEEGGVVILESGTEEQIDRCLQRIRANRQYVGGERVEDLAGLARGVRAVIGKADQT